MTLYAAFFISCVDNRNLSHLILYFDSDQLVEQVLSTKTRIPMRLMRARNHQQPAISSREPSMQAIAIHVTHLKSVSKTRKRHTFIQKINFKDMWRNFYFLHFHAREHFTRALCLARRVKSKNLSLFLGIAVYLKKKKRITYFSECFFRISIVSKQLSF